MTCAERPPSGSGVPCESNKSSSVSNQTPQLFATKARRKAMGAEGTVRFPPGTEDGSRVRARALTTPPCPQGSAREDIYHFFIGPIDFEYDVLRTTHTHCRAEREGPMSRALHLFHLSFHPSTEVLSPLPLSPGFPAPLATPSATMCANVCGRLACVFGLVSSKRM